MLNNRWKDIDIYSASLGNSAVHRSLLINRTLNIEGFRIINNISINYF